jgi:hypothetical protein
LVCSSERRDNGISQLDEKGMGNPENIMFLSKYNPPLFPCGAKLWGF